MNNSFPNCRTTTLRHGRVIKWSIGLILQMMLETGPGRAAEIRPTWQAEWERTLEAAKKEGQVNMYMSGQQKVLDAFQRSFPEIRLVSVTGRGGQLEQRVLAEKRANKHWADLYTGGSTTLSTFYRSDLLQAIKPALMLTEVIDASKWWQGRHRYVDQEGKYILIYAGVPNSGSISYNTHIVNPHDFKSVWDFVNLRWKGRIEARDPRTPGYGGGALRFFYHHPELGPPFLRRLFAEMGITLFRDFRQGTDWLVRGKFAICFFCPDIGKSKRQGLPVDDFGPLKEGAGLVAQAGTLGLMKNAPHPNAAKVFINWFLSRDGQTALQTALTKAGEEALDSLRIDIRKDHVPPDNRRVEGIKYLELDTEERLDMKPIFKILEEALAEGGK